VVDADELDCVGAWAGALNDAAFAAVFTADRVRAFRAGVRTLEVLAVDVFAGEDAAADLTTCALPVATTAATRAVAAVAAAAVQRVIRLTRRRPAVRILVSRVRRSIAMATSDQRDLAIGLEVPVSCLRGLRFALASRGQRSAGSIGHVAGRPLRQRSTRPICCDISSKNARPSRSLRGDKRVGSRSGQAGRILATLFRRRPYA
jgi:hypothetical protein